MKSNRKDNADNNMKYNVSINKPSSPHIMDSQVELTEEEYKKRIFVEEQLSRLGISTSVFDTDNDGYENPYILEAIILVNRGEEIPEELKLKIQEMMESQE